MYSRLFKRRRWPWLAGLLLTTFSIVLSIQPTPPHWLQRLDYLLYDVRFNAALDLRSPAASAHNIVIVDIDEASLAREGRWPWSRQRLGELVQALAEAGAVVVAFDVVFPEPERNPVAEIRQRLGLAETALPDSWMQQMDADRAFAGTLTATDVVLGFFFLDDAVQVGQLPAPVSTLSNDSSRPLVVIRKPGFAANLPVLQEQAAAGGFVTTFADSDGSVRRTPLLIRYGDQLYPSLSLATVMTYLVAAEPVLETAAVGAVDVIRRVTVTPPGARTDGAGQVIVPYRGGSRSFPYFSAAEALRHELPSNALDGAIVLIGTSALGLADLRTTPVGTQYPGVEVHASVVDGLLNGGFPYRPEWEAGATVMSLLVTGLVLSFLLPALGPLAAMLVSTGTAAVLIGGNFMLWVVYGLDLPMAALLLLTASLTTFTLGYGFLRESVSRRQLRGMFDQYVPPAHIERMMNDPDAYRFNGESKELTVLFSDIRSFTSISESLTAAALKQLLNDYFTPVTRVIFEHEGTIDKYVGDMVMAFWGAPLEDPCHAEHAVAAALAMQEETARLRTEFAARGWPEVHIGIGINTGVMNVGDMGSSYRRAYTVLGDAVNLGSRLESLTKYYGVGILVSEHTRRQAPRFAYRFIDCIQVKGKEEPVSVYQPLGLESALDDATRQELQRLDQAISAYRSAHWDEAAALFAELMTRSPSHVYALYRERIESLRGQELPAGWNGVYRHQEK